MLKPEWIPIAYRDDSPPQQSIAAATGKKHNVSRAKTLQINKKKYPIQRPATKGR
ncbi:hypothetical protein [uncultured Mucilaginibacter sp.]|uniref:hypothetical protein n=1 Tax=uncultured Mucilaginibacter sp. TaxID=797541 RepID=UPI0025E3A95A|nr:hypothetical protein [uncultured Mucilaginibacter sp.]